MRIADCGSILMSDPYVLLSPESLESTLENLDAMNNSARLNQVSKMGA
jgi:hypothetical protein